MDLGNARLNGIAVSPDAQRMLARQMEVFAGFLSHTDAQIGRVVAQLDALGELDNTLIMLISDNGTSGVASVGAGAAWSASLSRRSSSYRRRRDASCAGASMTIAFGWPGCRSRR